MSAGSINEVEVWLSADELQRRSHAEMKVYSAKAALKQGKYALAAS